MSKFPNHILAMLDPEVADTRVLQTAVALAEAHDAKASALTVLPPPLYIQQGLETVKVEFERDLTEAVEAALEISCVEHGIDVSDSHVVRGDLHDVIADFANETNIDLVCVGLHDRHGKEYFLGTTATATLRHVDGAVYGCRSPEAGRSPECVVIAVDGGEDTRAVLDQAQQFLSAYPQASIHVICAVRSMTPSQLDWESSTLAAGDVLVDLMDKLTSGLRNQLEIHMRELKLNSSSLQVFEGVASVVIKEFAEAQKADLIIMGTGTHIGIGWHIGSTTNNVMHGTHCDVLAVRPTRSEKD